MPGCYTPRMKYMGPSPKKFRNWSEKLHANAWISLENSRGFRQRETKDFRITQDRTEP